MLVHQISPHCSFYSASRWASLTNTLWVSQNCFLGLRSDVQSQFGDLCQSSSNYQQLASSLSVYQSDHLLLPERNDIGSIKLSSQLHFTHLQLMYTIYTCWYFSTNDNYYKPNGVSSTWGSTLSTWSDPTWRTQTQLNPNLLFAMGWTWESVSW